MSTTKLAIASLLAFALAAPAIAGEAGMITTQVAVKRIAVRSPGDARRLERHIAEAALEVCGASSFSLTETRAAVASSSCYKTAIAQAYADSATATAVVMPSRPMTGNP